MRRYFSKALVAVVAVLAVGVGLSTAPAEASPTKETSDKGTSVAKLVSKRWIGNQLMEIKVFSPSMNRVITNQVMTPPGMGRAPVFYLLSGMYGGDGDQWAHPASGARKFFKDKQVYVVNPMGAASTYYTNWYRKDRKLGYKPMWETYLTEELPPVVGRTFKTTGRNAIAGYSMSGGTALALLALHGDLYQAGASYSGCPLSANPAMQMFIMSSMIINTPGVNPLNAYAGFVSPAVYRYDPLFHIDKLRGKPLFLSASLGVPRMPPDDHDMSWRLDKSATELGTYLCTNAFRLGADIAGVKYEYYGQPYGAHSFGQFGEAMRKSWPMVSRALRTH